MAANMLLSRVSVIALLAPVLAVAQPSVRGELRDSLTGRPFVGATVQLVPSSAPWTAGLSTQSDSGGRFVLRDVMPGRYTFGFQHARLDSLGFDAVTRPLDVSLTRGTVRADLALPSATTLLESLCGGSRDTTGVIIGRVNDATSGAAARQTVVVVEWGELRLGTGSAERIVQRVVSAVAPDGRFVLCGVPTDIPVQLRAAPTATGSPASSGAIEV